jgi:hypothetical protein
VSNPGVQVPHTLFLNSLQRRPQKRSPPSLTLCRSGPPPASWGFTDCFGLLWTVLNPGVPSEDMPTDPFPSCIEKHEKLPKNRRFVHAASRFGEPGASEFAVGTTRGAPLAIGAIMG